MKKNTTDLVMSLIYIFLVLFFRGVYLYFDKNISILEAFQKVLIEFGNLLIIVVPGMILIVVFAFISNKYRTKKKNGVNQNRN
jgi:hypothetical protein